VVSTSELERACFLQILALEEQLKYRDSGVVIFENCILYFFGYFRTLVNWGSVGLFTDDGISFANGANLKNRMAIHGVDAIDAVVNRRLSEI
jgi:hypothetical protein